MDKVFNTETEMKQWLASTNHVTTLHDGFDESTNHEQTYIVESEQKFYLIQKLNGEVLTEYDPKIPHKDRKYKFQEMKTIQKVITDYIPMGWPDSE